ncbi:Shikimate dehydrogenase [Caloramator mitchellensis]|uniref:Shikimate dehydrogenase (NADP(+)) n=1 Tax=Caloramator mitchellensis TaxID=908809 RepID=A0A0R3JUW9_CALMK|nr:shikimate dehydrogenase [Caloramator mitchellensis]KRQ86858.1 Shikimate dehydrogenase [Caloramator mitchellensis]
MNNLYGLIGEKLSHSKSPEIHDLIMKKLSIIGNYHLFEVNEADLKMAIEGLQVLNFKGINVTIPYKIKIIDFLDGCSDEVKSIGSVNTIKFTNKNAFGYNTDYFGFISLLRRFDIDVHGKIAVILGTGGSSRAVMKSLVDLGTKEIIFASRNRNLNEINGSRVIDYQELAKIKGDLLINCTPVGMSPNFDSSPVEKECVKNFETIIDLIYNPFKTKLIKYADDLNIRAFNGFYMLVAQAVKSQEIWNNTKLSDDNIEKIYQELVENMFISRKKKE